MSGFPLAIPILTLVTALPLLGAAVALFAGRHARGVALITTLLSLALALVVWTRLPVDGSIGLVERAAWAPSVGIEYHLGVDGLGALMLVLSALVTLMSVDAAHRVHHQPGLYFALVLTLEAGLFGSFTALNFFHWFLFWELSLIPAFFLIKLWGGAGRGPAATQFFVYTMAGSAALLVAFLAVFLSTGSMDFVALAQMASTGALERAVTAHLGPVTLWLAIGVLAGFAVKVPMIPFHTWLPAAYAEAPSPVTMLLTGAMSKMGLYGLLRIALPLFGAQIAEIRTPLLVLAVATVVMGAWAAAAQKDLKRIFAYLSVNHLGYCLLGIFALAVPTPGGATAAALLTSQAAALNGVIFQMFSHGLTAAALLVCGHDAAADGRPSRHRRLWRLAQARASAGRADGDRPVCFAWAARAEWLPGGVPHLPRRFSTGLGGGHRFDSWPAGDGGGDFDRDSEGLLGPRAGALRQLP
jgi:NADH-quinone oxidoreductase subunit M